MIRDPSWENEDPNRWLNLSVFILGLITNGKLWKYVIGQRIWGKCSKPGKFSHLQSVVLRGKNFFFFSSGSKYGFAHMKVLNLLQDKTEIFNKPSILFWDRCYSKYHHFQKSITLVFHWKSLYVHKNITQFSMVCFLWNVIWRMSKRVWNNLISFLVLVGIFFFKGQFYNF